MTDADPAKRAPRPKAEDALFSWVIFALALAPRLYVALAWPREPVWDGHYYDFGARRIAAGLGYSDDVTIGGQAVWHPWCHYPVGYSGFLALFYAILGPHRLVGPLVNAIVGAATAVLAHRIGLAATSFLSFGAAGRVPASSKIRARIAGILVAMSPGLIAYTALLMTEPLAGFGALVALWAILRELRAPKPETRFGLWRGPLLAGIATGLTTLVRPPSIVVAPLVGVLLWAQARARGASRGAALRRAATGAGIATLVAVLTVLPWTLRNCRVMDGCAFVSTNAGWNLMIGTLPRAQGRFDGLTGADGCPLVTGQVQQDRCWADTGWARIAADPWTWLSLAPKKLANTFDHESFPMGYLGEADPATWPEARKATGRRALSFSYGALLCAALLGAAPWPGARRPRRALDFIGLAGLAAAVGLALYAAIADAHPLWPCAVAIPLLALVAWPIAEGSGPRLERSVSATLGLSVGAVVLTSIVFFGEDRYHVPVTPALCLLAAGVGRSASLSRPQGAERPQAGAPRTGT